MAELTTSYLGLPLANPFVVSSCSLTGTVKGVRQCAQAGAGAVVLKSLFEEQITAELGGAEGASGSAFAEEAQRWLAETARVNGPQDYLTLIGQAKAETDIPVIASVNAVTSQSWVEYAGQIQHAGADALELNIALMPLNLKEGSDQIEQYICGIVRAVRAATTLPMTVKVGPWYTSLPRIVRDLVDAGADGVVLFNRFYQLDIDPVALRPVPGYQYSSPAELPLPLRWVAILSPQIDTQYSLSTGVHSALDAVKALTAGAQVVQVASVLYLNRIGVLTTMIDEFGRWLDDHGIPSVEALRGRLASAGFYQPEELERLQYIRALTGVS